MATVGYRRVSTAIQHLDRQLEGITCDKYFEDTCRENTEHPGLKDLTDWVREGETVVIHSIDRLARNLVNLRQLLEQFRAKGDDGQVPHRGSERGFHL